MKQFCFFLLIVFSCLFTQAQSTRINVGLQSGLNLSTANGVGIVHHDGPLAGLHAGGYLRFSTGHWGVKLLASYDQMGWVYRSLFIENSAGTGVVETDIVFKLNYLNLPLVAEYMFGKKIKFHVDDGFFLGVLLKGETVTEFKEPIPPGQEPIPTHKTENRKPINFGLSFGAGLQFPVSSKLAVDIMLRDNIGLINIYKSSGAENSNMKTNLFTAAAGLTFEL